MRGYAHTISAVGVARPNLVALARRQMECHAALVRAEAQPVRQSFAGARELAGVGAVEVHAEDLADFIAHNLREDALISHEQRGRVKHREPFLHCDFGQRLAVEVVEPEMRRRLSVVFVERTARPVAPRLHAEKHHTPAIR